MTKKNRRKSKRRDRDFVAIPFDGQLALATLADNTVLAGGIFGNAFGEDIFIISLDVYFTIKSLTAGEGPIVFGVSHSDLSVGEVLEALQVELTDPDDIIQKERLNRPVRRVGVFDGLTSEQRFNNGVMKRQVVKFSVGDTFTLNMWAQNRSGAALTTGAIVDIGGTLFGRWQR